MYAAFEFMPNGNLRNFLRSHAVPEGDSGDDTRHPELEKLTPRSRLLKFSYDIALGMRHLSKNKVWGRLASL